MRHFLQQYLAHLLFFGVAINLSVLVFLCANTNKVLLYSKSQTNTVNTKIDKINYRIIDNKMNLQSIIFASEVYSLFNKNNSRSLFTNYDTITKLIFSKDVRKLIVQNGSLTIGSQKTLLYDTLDISQKEAKLIFDICRDYYLKPKNKKE